MAGGGGDHKSDKVDKVGPSDGNTFMQVLKRDEGESLVDIWSKTTLGRDNSKCKGPETEASLERLRRCCRRSVTLKATYSLLWSGVHSLPLHISRPHTSL